MNAFAKNNFGSLPDSINSDIFIYSVRMDEWTSYESSFFADDFFQEVYSVEIKNFPTVQPKEMNLKA